VSNALPEPDVLLANVDDDAAPAVADTFHAFSDGALK
jgi:hypothetical protein